MKTVFQGVFLLSMVGVIDKKTNVQWGKKKTSLYSPVKMSGFCNEKKNDNKLFSFTVKNFR